MALNLTTWTHDIVICTNGRDPDLDPEQCAKLDALNIPVLSARIERVVPQGDRIYALELEGGMHLDCDHIFFALSQRPADDSARSSTASATTTGRSSSIAPSAHRSSTCGPRATSRPGPSSPSSPRQRAPMAALSIHKSLVPNERELEPPGRKAPDAYRYQRSVSDCCFFFRMMPKRELAARRRSRSRAEPTTATSRRTRPTETMMSPPLRPDAVGRRAAGDVEHEHAALHAERLAQIRVRPHDRRAGNDHRRRGHAREHEHTSLASDRGLLRRQVRGAGRSESCGAGVAATTPFAPPATAG